MWRARVEESAAHGSWADRAVRALRRHGVVAFPTDTLYGLAADPRSERAIRKLYRIKGRAVDQAIPLIAAGVDQLTDCGAILPPLAARLAAAFWPGPLTLIVPAWPGLCATMLGGGRTVGVRVPDHEIARALAAAFAYPVTSTSANVSGQPAPADPDVVSETLNGRLDGIVDGGSCAGGPASTIVDACGETPRLVRAGAVVWERVLESER